MEKLSHEQIAELVVRAQNDDQQALAALYTATVDRQLGFAVAFLKDINIAEDVVQETYIKMFNNIKKLQNPKVFVAYLNRICYNTCVDYKKKHSVHKYELNPDAFDSFKDESIEAAPEKMHESKEENGKLYIAIGGLPEQQKAAFMLRYYYNMKVREIAKVMDVSESTVKRAVKNAIDALQYQLITVED